MRIYYIRHGKPIYDPDSLTEFGKEQAKALSKKLEGSKIEKIYSSDSKRALETAEPTAKALGLEIEKLHWCHEGICASEFNPLKESGGWTWCYQHAQSLKLFNSKEIISLGKNWYDYPAFRNLDYKKGILRINEKADEFLKNLGYLHDRETCRYTKCAEEPYKTVALFAHEGFGLAFLSSILDIPYPVFCSRFTLGLSHFTVIDFVKWDDLYLPFIRTFSNDSHLYKEQLKIEYEE